MRCSLLLLVLSTGTVALGQAGPVNSLPAEPLGQSPWAAPNGDFSKMPQWRWDPSLGSFRTQSVLLPPSKSLIRLGDAAIDPQILRHPSTSDLGAQPPATQLAQNEFPGLKFQPINELSGGPASGASRCEPGPQLLSTTWPKLQVEQIPNTWPGLKMGSVTERAGPTSTPDSKH